ncbi:hypothetical protein BC939DRAFT_467614 [Gamsiella multidivaricata]|uniref:uncharacterized protein n=1 Tax=Gamsiella multidivaricata TaxID=101098 RepID=UPI00221EE31F|nr:uncharacterized protein BC939DRAFT_467614 [Gamsiella multidivaricata]KAI7816875.1 hypothetical protein BC939DRAFT_467614 [Gamsiella multidivaricata]
MAEYWKSNAKFWCRFCKIYITDNKSTRNIHDSGTKHKENVERFLREQNQRGKEKEAETARMNKQMEAIEKAAMRQYQLDVEAGLVQPNTSSPAFGSAKGPTTQDTKASSTSTAPVAAKAAPSGVEPSANTQPSSKTTSKTGTGATGSNSEPLAAPKSLTETLQASNVARDENVGQPGEWQTVEVPAPRVTHIQADNELRNNEGGNHYVPGADDDEDAVDPEDLRGFKIVEKTYPVDPDLPSEDGNGESSGAAVFKKRKAGASKPRNIRRKV